MDRVLARLQAALDSAGPGALAFDADGTLWSGDVGEDAFCYALEHRLLTPHAWPAFAALADSHQLPRHADVNQLAAQLYDAYRAGQLPEKFACEMMAWGFAGWDEHELTRLIQRVLHERNLEQRRFAPLRRALHWAQEHQLPTLVVSASPDFVIHVATEAWNIPKHWIAACTVVRSAGVLLDHLQSPIPYLEQKVEAARVLAPKHRLLAAFGDNGFDVPLLQAAQIAVAVRPKPALVSQLHHIADVVIVAE